MGNMGIIWKNMGKDGKWENMGTMWENIRKYGNIWEQYGKIWENMRKICGNHHKWWISSHGLPEVKHLDLMVPSRQTYL